MLTTFKRVKSAINIVRDHSKNENDVEHNRMLSEMQAISDKFARGMNLSDAPIVYNSKRQFHLFGHIGRTPDKLMRFADSKYTIFISYEIFTDSLPLYLPEGYGSRLLEAVIAHEIGHAKAYEAGIKGHLEDTKRTLKAELEADRLMCAMVGVEASIDLLFALLNMSCNSPTGADLEVRDRLVTIIKQPGGQEYFDQLKAVVKTIPKQTDEQATENVPDEVVS